MPAPRPPRLPQSPRPRKPTPTPTEPEKRKGKLSILRWFAPLVVLLGAFWLGSQFYGATTVDTSEGMSIVAEQPDNIARAVINQGTQQVQLTLKKPYTPKLNGEGAWFEFFQWPNRDINFTYAQPQAKELLEDLAAAKLPRGYNTVVPVQGWFDVLLQTLVPLLLFAALIYLLFSRLQGGNMMGAMGFGKGKFKQLSAQAPKTKFSDVAGADEAVEELREIKEFLSNPDKFHNLGARIPKGVLLSGPPGTGKTLLAKAVAGEAGVPFFSLSGSEFVEMFVGVGASRVRDLFAQAKEKSPAIIFVDEIDAVGRHRGVGMGGGNDEREQTLNQLLVEMDGFDETTNIILIAATNRPDVLDPALLRPGRFDRQITVDAPDMKGRLAILRVHAAGKPLATEVDLAMVAKRTPGFTGADLANVLNEAALLTARAGAQIIDTRALDEAIDRVIAGPQRRTRVMNDHDKLVTAYHEGGHALCAAAQNYSDPVTKVTILPRGRALGYTMVNSADDSYSQTRNQLLDKLVYMMGGRVAEELVFEDPSTGASNDIEKATNVARRLVTDFGLSSAIGPVKLGAENTDPFLRGASSESRNYSEALASTVDAEVRALLDNAMREAWEILSRNRAVLDDLAAQLIERETILESDLEQIFAPVVKQPKRATWSYGREYAVPGAVIGNPIQISASQAEAEANTCATDTNSDPAETEENGEAVAEPVAPESEEGK